ncbi:MAG: ABC transporter permease, partial [Clostridiales bacterium]|nr:ABC transporter permease [Clostridiales bacterium]
MKDIWQGLLSAIKLIVTFDKNITEIVLLTLYITIASTLVSAIIAVPSAIFVSLNEFKFKKTIVKLTNTLMALPPVIAGLIVYILFSRKGPFGSLGILFTPTVMVIAQVLIVVPIIMGTTINIINTKGKLILAELN